MSHRLASFASLVLLVACGGAAKPPARPAPDSYVGARFRDGTTELPAGLAWVGDSIVGPIQDRASAVTWARQGDRVLVLLERAVVDDEARPASDSAHVLWEVVAVADLGPLEDGTAVQTLECSVDGEPDPWVVAVVPVLPACASAPASGAALRVDPARGQLERLDARRVTCRTPCDAGGVVESAT